MTRYIPYPTIDEAHERSRSWWESVLGRAKNPADITEFVYGRVIDETVGPAIVVAERDEWLDALVRADEMRAREAGEVAELYPAWALGESYVVDELVSYEGALYRCRQAHRADDAAWVPTGVPALWLVYRKRADDVLEWVAGERVRVGTQRTHLGVTYECIQAHVTLETWQPPATPALWQEVVEEPNEPQPWVAPTGAHDAYNTGDRVTHEGFIWESTADANVWEPGVFGWRQVGPV